MTITLSSLSCRLLISVSLSSFSEVLFCFFFLFVWNVFFSFLILPDSLFLCIRLMNYVTWFWRSGLMKKMSCGANKHDLPPISPVMWAVCALWWLGLAPWARATLGGCQSLLRPPGGYGRRFFGRMPVLAKVTAGCGRAGAALKGYLLEWVGWVGHLQRKQCWQGWGRVTELASASVRPARQKDKKNGARQYLCSQRKFQQTLAPLAYTLTLVNKSSLCPRHLPNCCLCAGFWVEWVCAQTLYEKEFWFPIVLQFSQS